MSSRSTASTSFSLELYRTNLEAIRGLEHPHQIEITVDGRARLLGTVGGDAERKAAGAGSITDRSDAIDARLRARVPVKAGAASASAATFIRKIGEGTQRLRPFLRSSAGTYDSTGRPHIETLTIAGSVQPRPGRATRRAGAASSRAGREAVGGRRDGVRDEDSVDAGPPRVSAAGHRGRDDGRCSTSTGTARKGTFETGIQLALRRLLASPTFIFRVEADPRS